MQISQDRLLELQHELEPASKISFDNDIGKLRFVAGNSDFQGQIARFYTISYDLSKSLVPFDVITNIGIRNVVTISKPWSDRIFQVELL